jgi:hypothetical protein
LAQLIADRSEPGPLSDVFVTIKLHNGSAVMTLTVTWITADPVLSLAWKVRLVKPAVAGVQVNTPVPGLKFEPVGPEPGGVANGLIKSVTLSPGSLALTCNVNGCPAITVKMLRSRGAEKTGAA